MEASVVGLLLLALFAGVFLAGLVVWIWALVDVIRIEEHELRTGTKLIWVIVILLANLLGAVLYLVLARPQQVS